MNKNEKNQQNENLDNEHTFQTIKARPVKLKENYDYFNLKWYRRFLSRFSVFLVLTLMKFFIGPIFFGFKVKNKKILKVAKKEKTGYIFISNHIHPLDSFLSGSAIYTKNLYYTMLMTNLGLPVAGKTLKFLGGAPIPEEIKFLRGFRNQMKIVLEKGAWVAVYPEAALKPYHDSIRPFKSGAIRFALDNEVKILPMVFVLKKPKGIYKLYKRKPLLHLHILEPYELVLKDSKKETLTYNSDKLHEIMSKYLEKQNQLENKKAI